MNIRIRAYNPYDLDIISLIEAPKFSVPDAMRETIKAYASGRKMTIKIPQTYNRVMNNSNYSYAFNIPLDEKADKEAISFLMLVPDGRRNAFIKNIFRASFDVSPFSLYFENPDGNNLVQKISKSKPLVYVPTSVIVEDEELAENEVSIITSNEAPDPERVIADNFTDSDKKKSKKKKESDGTFSPPGKLSQEESEEIDDLLDSMM